MKTPAVLLLAALFAGCGGEPPKRTDPTDAPPAPAAELALPVTAPVQSRDYLLHGVGQQKQQARDRAAALDEVIGTNR